MISFRNFLAEIAVDPSLALPSPRPVARTSSNKIVHGESDPSHAVMTLVVHPKYVKIFADMEVEVPWRHRQAMEVLGRLASQPNDGGLLAVNISNSEAASLKSMMNSIILDSEKVIGSEAEASVKDDAMRWMSSANAMLKSLETGVRTAAKS